MERKINIAVIGCSGMAEGHMYGVTDNGDKACLYGICDVDRERLELRKVQPPCCNKRLYGACE